jgi:hypothetical protein
MIIVYLTIAFVAALAAVLSWCAVLFGMQEGHPYVSLCGLLGTVGFFAATVFLARLAVLYRVAP